MNQQQKGKTIVAFILACTLCGVFAYPHRTSALVSDNLDTLSPDQLNDALDQKRNEQSELQKRIQQYQDQLAEQQKASSSLQNELSLLQTQLDKTTLDLEAMDFSIEEKHLEIEVSKRAVAQKQQAIDTQRSYLDDLVRTINRYDQQDPLAQLVTHNSFSEVVSDIRAATTMENQVTSALTDLRQAKANLELEQGDQERRARELESLQQQVQETEKLLTDQKDYKQQLLTDTQSSESKYNFLLQQAKQDQLSADNDIQSLQATLDKKLGGTSSNTNGSYIFTNNKNVQLAWPVQPLKGISTYFHDPTYPFRKYFEHPAIDIPAPQGTAIVAPADGYVARTHNGGLNYSYIMLVHSNEISTVYGHVSQINVAEDTFVKKGQIIGKSGGIPGTPGAGLLTTGAHLHFEVRLDGIPVNPLDYLP